MFTTVWGAISDPVMGYVIKVARPRVGRRHPRAPSGGLLHALFFLWIVPEGWTEPVQLFSFALATSMVGHPAMELFVVRYATLGEGLLGCYGVSDNVRRGTGIGWQNSRIA